MREMNLLVYKCRLCGGIYANAGGLFDFSEAAMELCKNKSNTVRLTGIHMCENGSLGVSDLLGLVPEREWSKCSEQANTTN